MPVQSQLQGWIGYRKRREIVLVGDTIVQVLEEEQCLPVTSWTWDPLVVEGTLSPVEDPADISSLRRREGEEV